MVNSIGKISVGANLVADFFHIVNVVNGIVGHALGPLCVMFAPTVAIERALRKALLQSQSEK